MDLVTALVEVVKALAWPVAVFAMALTFRRPLSRLIGYVESVKYKDLEVKVTRDLAEVRGLVGSRKGEEEVEENSSQIEGYELAAISPRAAILESWASLESVGNREMSRLLAAQPGQMTNRKFDWYLRSKGVLPDHIVQAIQKLRDVRNRVAHVVEFQPTVDEGREFVLLAKAIEHDLKEQKNA